MITVNNKYDFTVEELTEILNNLPESIVITHCNDKLAEYIIQALNVNRIIKEHLGVKTDENKTEGERKVYPREVPYHLQIVRNRDGRVLYENDARTIAFYAYDPIKGKGQKALISQKKPTPSDVANVSEYLGSLHDWGTMQ